jgi:aminoglycoside phosphotransferase family enzyme/predicted kinase
MATLREDLLKATAYPTKPDGPIELIETHISLVFLTGTEVFKVKKALDLGFLDFSTLARRRRACEAEVALNARLAPGVYLGVVPVALGPDGLHRVGGEGAIVDVAVHMKRLADDTRADVVLARGELTPGRVEAIARKLAQFHASARSDALTAAYGTPEAIGVGIEENFEQTKAARPTILDPTKRGVVERYQRTFLRDRALCLEARVDEGRIRDGHGDLRLEHVYLGPDDDLRIIDCIEFNERFRYADVAADIAFLAMDFAYQGHRELGEMFLSYYARESNDYDLYNIIDFYQTYRAFVRGKVSLFLADDPSASASVRARAESTARRHFELGARLTAPGPWQPTVVAVGGLLAAGKSSVARALGGDLAVPVVDSDRTRKFMAQLAPTTLIADDAWHGAYAPEATDRVYTEVLARARAVVGSGRSVIVDASFRSAKLRARAVALARQLGASFLFVECRAPLEVLRERLRARDAARSSSEIVSDGRLAILDDFLARWEPVVELAPDEHVVVDTSEELGRCLTRLYARRALSRIRLAA